MKTVVTFGEIMGRLTPPGMLRLRQALPGGLEVTFAGAEANVAVSIAQLGGQSAFVSALPDNVLADACIADLRGLGVDTSFIVRSRNGRMGLYFVETGANQRPGRVLYDREGSSIALASPQDYDFARAFERAGWLHVTGITPAISRQASEAALLAVRQAKETGLTVSCDLNFRGKLWRWDPPRTPRELAEETMRRLLEFVDVVIANEEDAADVLSIRAAETDVAAGKLAIDRYPDVARQIAAQFTNLAKVAITLRQSVSASHNNWGAMLYDAAADRAVFAPSRDGTYTPYEIRNIVDRVGGGDAFSAGLLLALNTPELAEPAAAAAFATAASCLAHSIPGDYNYTTREEVEALMAGSGAGRVVR